MLEPIEKLFQRFRDLGAGERDLITWITAFGCVVLLYINLRYIIAIVRGAKLYLFSQIQSNCCRIDFRAKYGQWAVISGATDGIGLALAHELARRGMSLIIIGRNQEKLDKSVAELRIEPNVGEVVAIKKDFSDTSIESYAELGRQIDASNRQIGVLINNVGMFSLKFHGFHNEEEHNLKTTIDVNILSTVLLSRLIIPSMAERKRGLVVNVSSILDTLAFPYFGIYASTKAFVSAFSRQLQCEYRNCGNLKIVNLTTGPVVTKPYEEVGTFNTERRWSSAFVGPQEYARSVVNILSKSSHPLEFSGLASHGLMKKVQETLDRYGLLSAIFERRYYRQQ